VRTTMRSQARQQRKPRVCGPLLPAAIRPLAVALLAVGVAVTALLGLWLMHQSQTGWLDSVIDRGLRVDLYRHRAILIRLGELADPLQTTEITVALVLACLLTRRWRGALLAAVAIPAAGALTEYLLKPLFDRTAQGHLEFPSGHSTGAFAMAAVCVVLLLGPQRPRLPDTLRKLLAVAAVLTAAGVAVAVVALGFHYFTDAVAGAAVGTAVVLATALLLDRLIPSGGPDRPAATPPEAARNGADSPARSGAES
jgi:membrane-associated phospholipid phosphatase